MSNFQNDWTESAHRTRKLLSEFIGVFGLTFILSGGAALLSHYGNGSPIIIVTLLSLVSALWLVCAVFFLGDISAHFNPAITLAFALRGDMKWRLAIIYFMMQFFAATVGSYTALFLFGNFGNLAATIPHVGHTWGTISFEAIITFGLVLMVLAMANGPKLSGQYIPFAVGAYVLAWGTMGGLFDGASMNPARTFGPDLAIDNLSTCWIYIVGPCLGSVIAVAAAHVLRGPSKNSIEI